MSKSKLNHMNSIRLFAFFLYVGGLCACTIHRVISPDTLAGMAAKHNWLTEGILYLGTEDEYHHFTVQEFGKKDQHYRVSKSALNVPSSMVRGLKRKSDEMEIYLIKDRKLGEWVISPKSELYRGPITWRGKRVAW